MFCSGCGKQILDDAAFCGGCGKGRDVPAKDRAWVGRWIGTSVIGASIILAVFMYMASRKPLTDPETIHAAVTLAPPPRPQPVLTEHSVPLLTGIVQIPARQLSYKCFPVGPALQNPTVTGSFRASGGFNNDIQLVVATEPEFNAWRMNGSGTLLFDSGRMVNGSVEQPVLPGGRYCAGFSNGFSIISRKAVDTKVALRFSTWDIPAARLVDTETRQ